MAFQLALFYISSILIFMAITSLVAAEDSHAKYINDMITKKVTEAQDSHAHSNRINNDMKLKVQKHLSDTKENNEKLKSTLKNHEIEHKETTKIISEKLNERKLMNTVDDSHRMKSTLKTHGVSETLVNEINNMVTSYIPKEKIVEHVLTHYPNKEPHEAADIVIAATAVKGNKQADSLDFKKSTLQEIKNNQQKFDRSKRAMENTKDAKN